MTISNRLRFTLSCAVPVWALGLGATLMSITSLGQSSTLQQVATFTVAVLLAPLYLLLEWWGRSHAAFPADTLALALVATIAFPMHSVINRRWATTLTVLGAVAWLLCELIVAGAPA